MLKNNNRLIIGYITGAIITLCLLGAAEPVDTLTDPTRPPVSVYQPEAASSQGAMIVTGIFIYPTYKVAIIDGKASTIGSQIGEYTITTITPNTVELAGSENTQQVLTLVKPVKVAK